MLQEVVRRRETSVGIVTSIKFVLNLGTGHFDSERHRLEYSLVAMEVLAGWTASTFAGVGRWSPASASLVKVTLKRKRSTQIFLGPVAP